MKIKLPSPSISLSTLIRILLLGAALAEAGYGLLQLCGVKHSLHHLWTVTGTFYNPGPFGCFLALSFPLALAEAAKSKGPMMWYASIVLLFDALMLPLSMSRTAWAAAALGSAVTFMPEIVRFFRRSKFLIPVSAVAIIACALLLFSLKANSAHGRLLIWKVALTAINPEPFSGTGPDHVAGAYGIAQETYFSTSGRSASEILVAGAPEYVFNEYLQTAIAFGWGTALLLILLFLSALFIAFKNHSFPFAGSLVASMAVMTASYPFQFPISSAAIALIIAGCFLSSSRWSVGIAGSLATTLFTLLLYQPFDHLGVSRDFKVAHALHKAGKWQKSNEAMMKLLPRTADPMPLNIIGKNWQQLGRPDSAEHYFKRAAHRCPNRIYPHYLLMMLYADSAVNLPEKAAAEAMIILNMNVKVSSPATADMRREAEEMINTHAHDR